MKELWKKVEGFPNYSVSNLGRVRNDRTDHILKAFTTGYKGNDYPSVQLHGHTIRVHRLVALAFIPNPEKKREVNHIDGDHFNNVVSNLEWVTGSENCIHAYRTLGKKKYFGGENPFAKKVIRIEDGKIYESLKDATRDIGLKSHSSLSRCLNGKQNTSRGFHWAYYEEAS